MGLHFQLVEMGAAAVISGAEAPSDQEELD